MTQCNITLTRRTGPALLLTAAAAFTLVAPPAFAAEGAEADGAAAERADTREPLDGDVNVAVVDALWDQPGVTAHLIDVTTADGIVTLTGRAPSLLAKRRAVASAETVRGVRAIVDRIVVDTPGVGDGELRRSVIKALAADPATDSYELDVHVTDGVVTLSGTVESFAEKELGATVASGVEGVREVRNDVTLLLELQRPDSEIAADVRGRLRADVWTSDADVNVTVTNGVVELSGAVESVAEKKRIRHHAWVAGVREVATSGVSVQWWERDPMERTDARPRLDDESIASAVEDAFLYDPRVLSYRPEIDVDGGFVTLTGTVGDLAARTAAEQDARNTHGVWGVRNQLRVVPVEPIEDAILRQRLDEALARDPYVNGLSVAVAVTDGAARLTGDVASRFEREHAEHVAERVSGILAVENHLAIPPVTIDVRDDLEIRREIHDELVWSPFVDADQVTISVSDGVATLRGEVDSWHERRMATKNAKDGGAVVVVNELRVADGTSEIGD